VLERYRQMAELHDGANRPYIHLVDGGVSDNIGARGVLDALEEMVISTAFREERGFGVLRRIVFIVVNARSAHTRDWEKKESPPGSIKQLVQSSGVPIERYSFETVELIKDRTAVADLRRRLLIAEAQLAGMSKEEAEARHPEIKVHVINVNFEDLSDSEERAFFMNLPTSFVLEEEEVDRLREVGGRLLRQSADYRELLEEIGTPVRRP